MYSCTLYSNPCHFPHVHVHTVFKGTDIRQKTCDHVFVDVADTVTAWSLTKLTPCLRGH